MDFGSTTSAFDVASQAVVRYLTEAVPLGCWAVTRYDGQRQVFLTVDDTAYGTRAGDSVEWSQTFCQHAVSGRAPSVVADTAVVPVYADQNRTDVGAFVGIPIRYGDGELFGTLCGVDPTVRPASFVEQAPLFQLLSTLLGTILVADLERAASERAAARATALAETDHLTGLLNRRGWERMLALHDEGARKFGDPGALIALDLDGLKRVNDSAGHQAGDALIARTADVLRSVLRPDDVVARLGGDEFAVLVQLPPKAAAALVDRIDAAFAAAGIAVSTGSADVTIQTSCEQALHLADEAMYAAKARRRFTLVS
jgi:diguanylate cyclase